MCGPRSASVDGSQPGRNCALHQRWASWAEHPLHNQDETSSDCKGFRGGHGDRCTGLMVGFEPPFWSVLAAGARPLDDPSGWRMGNTKQLPGSIATSVTPA